jgi:hypothetical protein
MRCKPERQRSPLTEREYLTVHRCWESKTSEIQDAWFLDNPVFNKKQTTWVITITSTVISINQSNNIRSLTLVTKHFNKSDRRVRKVMRIYFAFLNFESIQHFCYLRLNQSNSSLNSQSLGIFTRFYKNFKRGFPNKTFILSCPNHFAIQYRWSCEAKLTTEYHHSRTLVLQL